MTIESYVERLPKNKTIQKFWEYFVMPLISTKLEIFPYTISGAHA